MIVNLVLLVSSVSQDRILLSVLEVIIVQNTLITLWNILAQRVPIMEAQTSQMINIVCHVESEIIALKAHGRLLLVHRVHLTTFRIRLVNAGLALQVINAYKEQKSQFHVPRVDTLTKECGAALIARLVNSVQNLLPLGNLC